MNTTTNNPAMTIPANNIKYVMHMLDNQRSILRENHNRIHENAVTKDDDIAAWNLGEAIDHLDSVYNELNEVLGRLQ